MLRGPICKLINRNVMLSLYKIVDELGQAFAVSIIAPFQIEDWEHTYSLEFETRTPEAFR